MDHPVTACAKLDLIVVLIDRQWRIVYTVTCGKIRIYDIVLRLYGADMFFFILAVRVKRCRHTRLRPLTITEASGL